MSLFARFCLADDVPHRTQLQKSCALMCFDYLAIIITVLLKLVVNFAIETKRSL